MCVGFSTNWGLGALVTSLMKCPKSQSVRLWTGVDSSQGPTGCVSLIRLFLFFPQSDFPTRMSLVVWCLFSRQLSEWLGIGNKTREQDTDPRASRPGTFLGHHLGRFADLCFGKGWGQPLREADCKPQCPSTSLRNLSRKLQVNTFPHMEFLTHRVHPVLSPSLIKPGFLFHFWKRVSSGLLISR